MPRIVSLLASATEIVCALGRHDDLVGRSHECDYPLTIQSLPVCTRPRFPTDGDSATIDAQVKSLLAAGEPIYEVDADLLRDLRPDVILTQSHCVVCAVSDDDVARALIPGLEPKPRVVSLAPNSLRDFWSSITMIAEAIGADGPNLIAELQGRMRSIVEARGNLPNLHRPTVACIEWLDPLMAAGNWVPELVEMAGGVNLFGVAGEHSPWMTWDDLLRLDPEIIVCKPCGFDLDRTRREMRAFTGHPHFRELSAARTGRVFIADGNQYFNRPGPRLVESLEILDRIFHDVDPVATPAFERVRLPMGTLTEALRGGRTLLMDGAMGTECLRRGVMPINASPALIAEIHRNYAAAGAEVLLTNTFPIGQHLGTRAAVDLATAAGVARAVRPECWVLGSIGPAATGPNFTAHADFLRCVAILAPHVHGILLETCSDNSAFTAADWIRTQFPDLPVLVSFAFAPGEETKATALAQLAQRSDIAALGVNCGREQSPTDIGNTLALFRRETTKPLFARPNAGSPQRAGDDWVYPLSPEIWAAETATLCDQGLAMIGGCCGTTPEHLRQLRERVLSRIASH